MSINRITLRRRLTRAAAAVAAVGLVSPLALIDPASADTASPGTVTLATVLDATNTAVAAQTSVAPNGPLTGLVNGSKVRLDVNAAAGNNGKFFGLEARLCRPGVNISNLAAFNPSDLGNCIDAPFNAASDDFVDASASPTNTNVQVDFRVGSGSRSVAHAGPAPNPRTITCDSANPCTLWLKEFVDTTVVPSGTAYIHYDLFYAGAPDTPTAVNAAAGNTQATVNWTAPVNTGNAALLEYEVVVAGGPGAGTFLVPAAQTSTTITGLSNFTAYTVTVAARNRAADGVTTFTSPPSAPATSVTPGPGGPTNVTGVPGDGVVDLTWTAPTGPAPDSYEITANPGAIVQSTADPTTSHTFTGLTNGTVYTFTVRARYGASFGASSAPSAGIAPAGRLVNQVITARRPQGALVLTQVCGARGLVTTGTAPVLGSGPGTDPLFGQYPYPVDANGDSVANYPTTCAVQLGNGALQPNGQFFRATGFINQVTVVDTRGTDTIWEASGQMGPFTSGSGTFGGSQLGWTPIVTDDSDAFTDSSGAPYDQTVTAGAAVAPNTPSGLGAGKRLAISSTGASLGIARLDADLEILIPVFANAGTYTGTLTITAV